MKKKAKTKAEKDFHERVAELDCVLCGIAGHLQTSGTTVHHARAGQGMSQRAGHFIVAALCHDCHQGPLGIHGDRSLLKLANVSELDLVDITISRVFR